MILFSISSWKFIFWEHDLYTKSRIQSVMQLLDTTSGWQGDEVQSEYSAAIDTKEKHWTLPLLPEE